MDTPTTPSASEPESGENRQLTRDALEADREARKFLKSLVEFLTHKPRNYSAAGVHFGISRGEVMQFVRANQHVFDDLDDAWLDGLEEKVYRSARGDKEEELKNFSSSEALKVLKERRPGTWGGKGKSDDIPQPTVPNAGASKAVEKFNERHRNALKPEPRPKPTIIRLDDPDGSLLEDPATRAARRADSRVSDVGVGVPGNSSSDV